MVQTDKLNDESIPEQMASKEWAISTSQLGWQRGLNLVPKF
ncbi:hypothetical protein [Ammoniphilus sp. 3BR4]